MGIINGRYRYLQDLSSLASYSHAPRPLFLCRGPTPIHLNSLLPFLHRHPDQAYAKFIFYGIQNGFHVGFDRSKSVLKKTARNHPSALEHPEVVTAHILDELQAGRLICPPMHMLNHPIHTSPVGLVPKPHVPNKWRLIVDLSHPKGHSVNDGISPELCSLQYASVDNAVELIMQLGRHTQLVKLDLSNAYRNIPVHPDEQPLLGITWQGAIYIDRALPFGLRSAPKIFSAVADFFTWVLYCEGVEFLMHYLDDFLLLGPPNTDVALRSLERTMYMFGTMGVPIATHKTEGPSTNLVFLGIMIDTAAYQLSLPQEKVQRLQELLVTWVGRRSCTRKELESLLGHLSHAATVIRPGRVFLRHLFSLLSVTSNPNYFIRLNAVAKADLQWWQCLLRHWNGHSFFPPQLPSVHVYSDASGSYGCGAFQHPSGCFQLQWPPSWVDIEITAKELVPIVVAAALWGREWAGGHVCFHSDNEAVVSLIHKRYSKHKLLTHLLRCLFFYASYYTFHYSAVHIPGHLNTAADALSRNNFTLFSSLFPQTHLVQVPMAVQNFLIRQTPDWGSSSWTELFTSSLTREFQHPPQNPTNQV